MIAASDFICLPCAAELIEAGLGYACRSLPHTYDRMGGSTFDRLRRIVIGIAVELAFRRYLAQQQVHFDVRGATPFTEPDRYDVALGGHRCDIKSFLISHRDQVAALHEDPGLLLQAPALIPMDQFAGEGHSDNDLYLFAFVTGLIAATAADTHRAFLAGQRSFMIHAMPGIWVRPRTWSPIGGLVLKSESNDAITVELGGQDASREFITRKVELQPRTRLEVEEGFYSLAYLHVASPLEARLGVHFVSQRETYVVQPTDWGNVWVYGMRIYLTGWTGRDEFRQTADVVAEGSSVYQYDRTRTRNLAVPVAQLHPLTRLIERARTWPAARSNVSG